MTLENKRRGRPPGHVPGSRREGKLYRVRASIAEAQVIDAGAEAANLSITEFFIQAALKAASGLENESDDDPR